ncbi:hypothetical protein ACVDG5_018045 [Mesorhizobium sp. ORM6]
MDIRARLEALAALPKEWRCTTTFSDGHKRVLEQALQGSIESYAKGQRRYLGKVATHGNGKPVIGSDGKPVTLVSVIVEKIAR